MHDEPTDPSETIRMLTDSASAVVSVDRSLSRIRAARFQSPGFSRDTWGAMADMGWLGLRVGEAAGGLDLGVRETVALARVLGGGLVPEPYLASFFALDLLEAAGLNLDMAPVLSGDVIVLPAWQAAPDALDPKAGVTVSGGRLTGIKIAIPSRAELFVVTARDGIALVPRDAQGLTITGIAMHDGTFRETLTFDAVACEVHPCAAMDKCLHDAMLLHAAYLQGAAARAFEITLDHLRMRTQFDVPIGSFQALQHRATEIKVQLELARAVIDAAATALDAGQAQGRTRMAVLRARTRAGGLARLVAREAVQMHGAMGYTDEADIGLFTRKLMVEAGQFAPEFRLRAQFMALREAAA